MEVLRRYSRYPKPPELSQEVARRSSTVSTSPPPVRNRVHKLEQRLAPEVIAQLVAEYEAGTPTTKLTEQFGLSKGAVLKLLHEAGASMRQQALSERELAEARLLYESGLSLVAVGERVSRHHTTVHLALRRAGVAMRPRKGGRKRRQ